MLVHSEDDGSPMKIWSRNSMLSALRSNRLSDSRKDGVPVNGVLCVSGDIVPCGVRFAMAGSKVAVEGASFEGAAPAS